MKKIGIVGGLGPEATVDYYNGIINAFKTDRDELNYPEMIIYSMNLSRLLTFMRAKEYDNAISYVLESLEALKSGGAEFAAISANTPHMFFDRIREKSPLPIISIVESTRDESIRKGYKHPGLFGTGFTMNGTFYRDVFGEYGIEIVVPDENDRKLMDQKLFSEIELGIFKDNTRMLLIKIIEKMVREKHIDSLILGCTEFPLILTESTYAGIPMLNTTMIHVDSIVKYCRGD